MNGVLTEKKTETCIQGEQPMNAKAEKTVASTSQGTSRIARSKAKRHVTDSPSQTSKEPILFLTSNF